MLLGDPGRRAATDNGRVLMIGERIIYGIALALTVAAAHAAGIDAFRTSATEYGGIDGVWQTDPAHASGLASIRIAPCAHGVSERCGTIVDVGGGASRGAVGRLLITGMKRQAYGRWRGGKIVHPLTGTVWRAKLDLAEAKLRVRGCAVFGLICGGQTWTRR